MAVSPTIKAKVTELLKWMQANQPNVYKGLVKRFNPPAPGLSGIADILSNTVNSVSNFVSSQGFNNILTAAAPFIANRVQSQQLTNQIRALQAGVPLPGAGAAASAPAQTTASTGAGTALSPHAPDSTWWSRIPTVGKIAGIGLLLIGGAYMMGGVGRRHNRRA